MKIFFLYLDAGSGSYLIQVIIGAALAGTIYFKTLWMKVKSIFGKSNPLDEDDTEVEKVNENNTGEPFKPVQ